MKKILVATFVLVIIFYAVLVFANEGKILAPIHGVSTYLQATREIRQQESEWKHKDGEKITLKVTQGCMSGSGTMRKSLFAYLLGRNRIMTLECFIVHRTEDGVWISLNPQIPEEVSNNSETEVTGTFHYKTNPKSTIIGTLDLE